MRRFDEQFRVTADFFRIARWINTILVLILGGKAAMAQTPAALPGDSLVVGAMSITTFGQVTQSLPLPTVINQKFCGLVELAPGLLVEAYVPTAAERSANFSAFAGLLVDPITTNPPGFVGAQPFPGGIIPTSRLADPYAWRISSGSGSSSPGCVRFPAFVYPVLFRSIT